MSVAESVSPEKVPVTVWFPGWFAEQVLSEHEPFGAIENAVFAVTLPIESPSVSNASAL